MYIEIILTIFATNLHLSCIIRSLTFTEFILKFTENVYLVVGTKKERVVKAPHCRLLKCIYVLDTLKVHGEDQRRIRLRAFSLAWGKTIRRCTNIRWKDSSGE